MRRTTTQLRPRILGGVKRVVGALQQGFARIVAGWPVTATPMLIVTGSLPAVSLTVNGSSATASAQPLGNDGGDAEIWSPA